MDALPLLLNQHQLDLMQKLVNEALADLQHQRETGKFEGNEAQKEDNLLTYGTTEYQEAHDRMRSIDQELQSQLKRWDGAPDEAKPVQIPLDSYQLKVIRMQAEQHLQTGNGSNDNQALLEDLIEQLPEFSAQEHAD